MNKRFHMLLGGMLAAALLTGCQSRLPQGVHPDAIPVGSGIYLEFEAPVDGIVFVVDSKTNEAVYSTTISAGHELELLEDSDSTTIIAAMLAFGPRATYHSNAFQEPTPEEMSALRFTQFALYFVPLSKLDLGPDQEADSGPEGE